jgi:hypothetical protein
MRRNSTVIEVIAREPVRWLTAAVIELMLSEIAGVRHYIARFESRGNTSTPYYYWYFQGTMLLLLIVAGLLKQERRSIPGFVALGAIVGYLVSFITFHASLAVEMGGIGKVIESWGKLPSGTVVSLMLLAPLILLSPVVGGVLFGIDGLIAHRSREQTQVADASVVH